MAIPRMQHENSIQEFPRKYLHYLEWESVSRLSSCEDPPCLTTFPSVLQVIPQCKYIGIALMSYIGKSAPAFCSKASLHNII